MVTNGKEGKINGAVKITTVGACHYLNGQCCGLEGNFPHIAEAVIATKLKLGVDQRVLQRNFPAHIHLQQSKVNRRHGLILSIWSMRQEEHNKFRNINSNALTKSHSLSSIAKP
jgi:hypothetical protein